MTDTGILFEALSNIDFNIPSWDAMQEWEEHVRFLGIKIINIVDFMELLVRLALNLLVSFIVIHYIYAKNSNRKDFYFSFFAVGTVVFLLSFLLNSVNLNLALPWDYLPFSASYDTARMPFQ